MNDSIFSYTIDDYQKQKPFSSFLSGIAGKMGIPLWAFYVNRGQLIASFGIRDKNSAVMDSSQQIMHTIMFQELDLEHLLKEMVKFMSFLRKRI